MKKIILVSVLLIVFSITKADTLQNNSGVIFNIAPTNVGLVVQCDVRFYLTHSLGTPYSLNPITYCGTYPVNTTSIKGYYLTLKCKDLFTGDTCSFKFRPGDLICTTSEKKDSNCLLPPMYLHRHWKLDSALLTGAELKTSYTFTLPHHGNWRIMGISTHTPCTFRDKKISNIDTFNMNPNPFLSYGGIAIHDAMTVVGYCEINTNYNNGGVHYMTETNSDWNYFDNDVENTFNLGITPVTATDSIVVTQVPTITSNIPSTIAVNPTSLNYLFDTIKNVSFRSGFTLNHPFNCDSFSFNSATQEIKFRTEKGTPQQAASLNFKIDVYRMNQKINTSYRNILCVIKEALATPNGITEMNKNEISVYPNPASNFFLIENYSGPVEICNFAGQTFFDGRSFSKIDVSTWPNGLYLIKMTDHTAKIVIRH